MDEEEPTRNGEAQDQKKEEWVYTKPTYAAYQEANTFLKWLSRTIVQNISTVEEKENALTYVALIRENIEHMFWNMYHQIEALNRQLSDEKKGDMQDKRGCPR